MQSRQAENTPKQVSLDDSENLCIAKGRELRAAIRGGGGRVAKQAIAIFGQDLFFMERAVGLLARTILCKAGQMGAQKPELGDKILLIATYFQGCGLTELLILEGQYAKAAAALKQDLEILTRIQEISAGKAKRGKTPNISNAPVGSGRIYGNLNSIAHPSNERLLHLHLQQIATNGIRGVSPIPVFRENTVENELKLHCWLCYAICRESLLVLIDNYGEADELVLDCASRFELLEESGLSMGLLKKV